MYLEDALHKQIPNLWPFPISFRYDPFVSEGNGKRLEAYAWRCWRSQHARSMDQWFTLLVSDRCWSASLKLKSNIMFSRRCILIQTSWYYSAFRYVTKITSKLNKHFIIDWMIYSVHVVTKQVHWRISFGC